VGSDFQLEGPTAGDQSRSTPAGDISVDYQLSKDGRYMIRVYQENDDEIEVQRQVVETGVSFILSFDYDKFNEIFKGRKEAKRVRKINKEITKQDEAQKQQQEQQQGSQTLQPVKTP
jgi:hypothetical protein